MNTPEFAVILAGRNKLALLSDLDLEVNKSVSTLFRNFTMAFQKLEASSAPTKNLVIPCYYRKTLKLKRLDTDAAAIQILEESSLKSPNDKFYDSIKAIHWMGTFLDPSFRSIPFMPKSSRTEFKERILVDLDTWENGQVYQLKPSIHEEPPVARGRVETTIGQRDDFFSDMREEIAERPQVAASVDVSYDENMLRRNTLQELEEYKTMSLTIGDFDVLMFWGKNVDRFMLLSSVTRKVLETPPSSGQSERLYSDCGLTVFERRRVFPEFSPQLKTASIN